MRSLSKQPGEGWKVIEIQNELEGRIKGMPYNTTICGVSFVGPILIVGTAGEDFSDLTERQEARLRAMGILP